MIRRMASGRLSKFRFGFRLIGRALLRQSHRRAWRSAAISSLLIAIAGGCGGPAPADEGKVGGNTRQANSGDAEDADEIDLTLVPGRVHVVKPKETLWSLSEMYYGNNRQWRKILVANRRRVTDPTNLPVGMKLIIP